MFFILKKCTERAFSTYSAQAACALVNHINSLLEREYHDALEAVFVDYERKYTPSQKKPVFLRSPTAMRAVEPAVSCNCSLQRLRQVRWPTCSNARRVTTVGCW